VRIRVADVLGGKAHEAAHDVKGILAAFYHPGEPVEARVGVGAPDAFVKGADEVVVHLAGLVVPCGLLLVGLLHDSVVDDRASRRAFPDHLPAYFQEVQRPPRVAVGEIRDLLYRCRIDGDVRLPELFVVP